MAELTDTQWYELLAALPERPEVAEGWEMALVRRTADRLVREHVTAALDEIERRIEAASWFTFDDSDVSPDEEFVRRSDAQHIVRGYRQEQDR